MSEANNTHSSKPRGAIRVAERYYCLLGWVGGLIQLYESYWISLQKSEGINWRGLNRTARPG